MDAFISHASQDREFARQLETELQAQGLDVWLDDSDIHVGALLRGELQTAITRSAVVVLLWSAPAARSRWVEVEWLMGVNLGRPVLPCTLDAEPLPQCLRPTVALDSRRDTDGFASRLGHAIREASGGTPAIAPVIRFAPPQLNDAVVALDRGQREVLERLDADDLDGASQRQRALDSVMAEARERWSFDPVVLNLEGYHHKNAYMVRYSAAINAGRPPQDELLRRAENRFLETLTIDPTDPSALNGLGSILMLELELDAAEFFILAAIAAARKRGLPAYEAAESDLEVVRYYRSVSPTSSQRHP